MTLNFEKFHVKIARLGTGHQFLAGTFGFSLKIPPFLRKLITFVKQNTHDLAGSFQTLNKQRGKIPLGMSDS